MNETMVYYVDNEIQTSPTCDENRTIQSTFNAVRDYFHVLLIPRHEYAFTLISVTFLMFAICWATEFIPILKRFWAPVKCVKFFKW